MTKQQPSGKQPSHVLVDGSSYLYRAFHALPPLSTRAGQPTWVIRGVTSMLKKLKKDYPESHIVVIFDAKGKTFRNTLYPDYKAHRPPMPDDLRCQIEPLHAIIRAMGFPVIIEEGVEADDVIGTLATLLTGDNSQSVLISTGDKDMAQLVCDRITLVDTMKGSFLDAEGVEKKFGVRPELIIDLLALQGDKSDNIPGVPKVGEKTALVLLQQIGGMDTIYENLDKIPALDIRGAASLAKRLDEHREQAMLSRDLATIRTTLTLDAASKTLTETAPDHSLLLDWFKKLEFNAWTQEMENLLSGQQTEKPDAETPLHEYETVFDKETFLAWLEKLKSADFFSFDTETTSLNYMQAELVGISFAVASGHAAYVPLAHDYAQAPEQLDRDWVLKTLKPLLENSELPKAGQHLKYDKNVLARYGIDLQGITYDTMLESYVLDSTATRHDMNSLAKHYLNVKTVTYEEVAGKGKAQKTFNEIPIEQASHYAAEDADIVIRLHETLWPTLQSNDRLAFVYDRIERPLINVLSRMEQTGTLIDTGLLETQTRELTRRIKELEQEAWHLAGEEFNLGSPKQLQTLLFEKQGLPVIKKTPKGQPSTAENVLSELALDYPLPATILEYRSLSKLCSTYTEKLPGMVDPDTGRLHTSYHQAVTATGRLSSTDPNLQNIPVRTEEGRKIRQAFIAQPGYQIVAADYSQIELRIMAHLSKDEGLISAFSRGMDIHKATAAEVFGVHPDKVSLEQRRRAKAINFGLIYGMSAFGLAKQLGISRASAQEYVNLYFERYPGVKRYMENIRNTAKEKGYVETLCGRRLYLPEINSRNAIQRQAAERTAINAPMQGSAADIIKLAMIELDQWIREQKPDVLMTMQVHDELVFEVRSGHVEKACSEISSKMTNALKLDVPLVVDMGTGNNWEEAH